MTTELKNLRQHYPSSSLVEQIASIFTLEIEQGVYKRNQKLPSINTYSKDNAVARDTIEKAYGNLKKQGIIRSVAGKGYFVTGSTNPKMKVLLLFNKICSYKKVVYDAIVTTCGDKAKIDIQVHNYDLKVLEELIDNYYGSYHYYVIMPHFGDDTDPAEVQRVLAKIPLQQLILLDKDIENTAACTSIYQDFENDIYNALHSVKSPCNKYQSVTLIFPPDRNHPREIIDGTYRFCKETSHGLSIKPTLNTEMIKPGQLFIIITEDDLGTVLKLIRNTTYILGKDIGVISFNETIFKELLNITVITTAFDVMGKTLATQLLSGNLKKTKNPSRIIVRGSL